VTRDLEDNGLTRAECSICSNALDKPRTKHLENFSNNSFVFCDPGAHRELRSSLHPRTADANSGGKKVYSLVFMKQAKETLRP
jgi:hypothetical protein